MLSYDTTRLLERTLQTISEYEVVIEHERQEICKIPKFAPYSAFCRIDRDARECIDSRAFLEFLKANGVSSCNIGDCAKLVRFFDSDGDGVLSYQDFLQLVLPCDDMELRSAVQRRPYSRVGRFDSLPYDQESQLVTVVKQEIDFMKRVESLSDDLACCADYSV